MDRLHWQVAGSEERQAATDNAEKSLGVFSQTPGERILFDLKLIEMRRNKTPNPIRSALKAMQEEISDEGYRELEASILSELQHAAEKTIEARFGKSVCQLGQINDKIGARECLTTMN